MNKVIITPANLYHSIVFILWCYKSLLYARKNIEDIEVGNGWKNAMTSIGIEPG